MNNLTTTPPTPPTSLAQQIGADGDRMTDLQVAEAFALSGFWGDIRSIRPEIRFAAQAYVKIQMGKELGLGPVASMTSINIIGGKPELGGKGLAALIRRSDRYDYTINTLTNDICTVVIHDSKLDERTEISHTMEDAKRAKLDRKDNYLKHPRNMLFARAISMAANLVCPDVGCMPLYGSGELTEASDPDVAEVAELAEVESVEGAVVDTEGVRVATFRGAGEPMVVDLSAVAIDTQGVRSALGEAVRHATEGEPLPKAPGAGNADMPPASQPKERLEYLLAKADQPEPNYVTKSLEELGDEAEGQRADIANGRWLARWGHVALAACPDCHSSIGFACRTKSGSIASKAHRGRLLASKADPLRPPTPDSQVAPRGSQEVTGHVLEPDTGSSGDSGPKGANPTPTEVHQEMAHERVLVGRLLAQEMTHERINAELDIAQCGRMAEILGESNSHMVGDLVGDGNVPDDTARGLYHLTVARCSPPVDPVELWRSAGVDLQPGVVIPRAAAREVLEALPKNGS